MSIIVNEQYNIGHICTRLHIEEHLSADILSYPALMRGASADFAAPPTAPDTPSVPGRMVDYPGSFKAGKAETWKLTK